LGSAAGDRGGLVDVIICLLGPNALFTAVLANLVMLGYRENREATWIIAVVFGVGVAVETLVVYATKFPRTRKLPTPPFRDWSLYFCQLGSGSQRLRARSLSWHSRPLFRSA
jgi:hypothetical protein